jgi:hypothetical protein
MVSAWGSHGVKRGLIVYRPDLQATLENTVDRDASAELPAYTRTQLPGIRFLIVTIGDKDYANGGRRAAQNR